MAAAAARILGVRRAGDRAIAYTAPDAHTAHNVCRVALVLAGAAARNERL
jgi:hypothetical protein